jgi:hypothetical protein
LLNKTPEKERGEIYSDKLYIPLLALGIVVLLNIIRANPSETYSTPQQWLLVLLCINPTLEAQFRSIDFSFHFAP